MMEFRSEVALKVEVMVAKVVMAVMMVVVMMVVMMMVVVMMVMMMVVMMVVMVIMATLYSRNPRQSRSSFCPSGFAISHSCTQSRSVTSLRQFRHRVVPFVWQPIR